MTDSSGVALPTHWPKEPDAGLLKSLVDTHAHPTDYKQFKHEKEEYRDFTSSLALRKVCAMSSHLHDQALVKQLYQEHPDKIVPAFGLHPWWSHNISFVSGSQPPPKQEHYASVFPSMLEDVMSDELQMLLESFPKPTLMSTFVRDTLKPLLLEHPTAILGEVGLDRSFRIPFPQTDAKSDRSDHKQAKKFTNLKVPMEHQLQLLNTQLDLAFELNRNVSFHDVQAHGAVMDLLASLAKNSERWKKSTSKICLHSFGGSVDVIQRVSRHIDKKRIYFSFSTTINARLERLEELIRAVPDDRLLIESDYNDIRLNEIRIWEILGIVCEAKGWTAEHAVNVLQDNWNTFSNLGTIAESTSKAETASG